MAKKPQIRFKEYEDEWKESQLKKEVDYSPTGVRACDVSIDGQFELYDANEVIGKVDSFASDKPYISIIKDGSGVGRVRLLPEYTNVLGTMGVITPKDNNDVNFIYSHIQTKDFKKHIISGAIPHVYFKNYGEDEIILPLSDEQTKIGEFFKALDELIGAKEEELEKLRQLKQALLQQMFPSDDTENVNGGGYKSLSNNYLGKNDMVISSVPNTPRIRFKGFTEPWDRKPLNSIGYTYNGLSGKRKEDFGHGKARYITYMNVFSHTIAVPHGVDSIEIDNNQNQVKYGDVLFTTSSETPDEVGMSSVWLGHEDNVYLNSFCFGYRPTITIYPYYLAYSLHTPRIRRCFYLLAQGISRFNISKQKAMDIKLDLPSFEEQRKVGDFFYEQDMVINASQDRINKLKIIKQSLLQKMFAA